MRFGLGLGLPNAPIKGVPAYLTIDGVLCVLLLGADGYALQGADGAYLYGVA